MTETDPTAGTRAAGRTSPAEPAAERVPLSQTRALAPARSVGGFFAMSFETVRAIGRRGFPFGEFVDQTAFIARVALFPAVMFTIPFVGVVIFLINQLLNQIGAIDLSGAGVGLAVVLEIAPLASVFVVAGAGATAITADLGARVIREEIDAMEVLGLNPVQRLVLPRVLASMLIAAGMNMILTVVGVATGYFVSVTVQGASAGNFVQNLTLLAGLNSLIIGEVKAVVFGLGAGLVACYRGLTVKGGPRGVGQAVNETVILTFVVLIAMDNVISAITLHPGG